MINFTSKPRYDLSDLIRLVHVLRAPGGCPWDAAQTQKRGRVREPSQAPQVLRGAPVWAARYPACRCPTKTPPV